MDATPWHSPWIWTAPAPAGANVYVGFRRRLTSWRGAAPRLELSADARYWLWVNGAFVGFGPGRDWPEHWTYDAYDLAPWWRARGGNLIAVLVNHWTEGNFQYIAAPAGLTARLRGARGELIDETGPTWETSPVSAERGRTPRVAVQQGFEEHHDARLDDGWRAARGALPGWSAAVVVAPPHGNLNPRSIPRLTDDRAAPVAILSAEEVAPCAVTWNLSLKASFAPEDHSSNFCFVRGFVVTQIHSAATQTVEFIRPHHHAGAFWVEGVRIPPVVLPPDRDVIAQPVRLRRGWNRVVFPFPGYADAMAADLPAGGVHLPVFVLAVRSAAPLRWACYGARGGAAWAFAGPFPLEEAQRRAMEGQADFPRVVQASSFPTGATRALARRLATGDPLAWTGCEATSWYRPLAEEQIAEADVFASWCGDTVARVCEVPRVESLLGHGGLTIPPPASGGAVRLLFDFGRMLVGRVVFELEAPAGAVVDFHGFEFIQRDGRHNLATGMNNTLRYTCRAGRQVFRSLQRRGFRYAWLTLRGLEAPLRLRGFHVEVSTYPQARRGAFRCSDALLNRIHAVGADTLRWCAEDTYTDCPSYEQTHWIGDTRNEALVDWVVNGDPRLWHRCLVQAGQGLARFPIVPSHVPSSWENLLPAWSFLWMRSCREYFYWTGDRTGAERLFPALCASVDGIAAHVGADGLFRLHAWNLFDWAAMETPSDGTVTHVNCLAVLALRDAAELAAWLGRPREARAWRRLARSIGGAVNRHLWDEADRAYADCRHAGGRTGAVRSQQTQAAALLAGVATGARARRCRVLVATPPEGFVRAGSPFFVFFQLELLARARDGQAMLDLIRRDWGFMIEAGATSFWELWTLSTGRLTRSHCHGWSSAPTYFLSAAILGVWSGAPGSREIRFDPQPGDLRRLSGRVPTPWGVVRVSGRRTCAGWNWRVRIPAGCRLVSDSTIHHVSLAPRRKR